MRRELDFPHRVAVAVEHRDRNPNAPHVPNFDRLVDGGRGDAAVVVLVPIAREDLELVSGDDHGGARLTHVPDA